MQFRTWLLEGQTPVFFLRTTQSPDNDLKRGWSCHAHGWANSKEEAYEAWEAFRKNFRPNALPPQRDLQYGGKYADGTPYERWCYMVEPGLSGYAFWDDNSLRRSKVRIENYIDSFGPSQKLAVFQSDKFKLGNGSDGEDTFLPGTFVGWIRYTDNFDVVAQLTKRPVISDWPLN